MIFNFLRQYLKDDEFEQNKIELAETKAVLQDYKDFILEQKESTKNEREKVDPDFLVFVWATVGFAFLIFGESGQNAIALQESRPIPFYVWSTLVVFSIVFIVLSSIFALGLTKRYAASKSDPEDITFAYYLIIGAILLVGGVIGIAFLK